MDSHPCIHGGGGGVSICRAGPDGRASQKGAWFVLTIPRFKGEEQMEGFVE